MHIYQNDFIEYSDISKMHVICQQYYVKKLYTGTQFKLKYNGFTL